MQCVILAGGLGTRMAPATEQTAKSMLRVAGHPFLKYQLDWLASQGVSDVMLCIGHQGEQIREYVGDGRRWSLKVDYTEEPQLRGTGGALKLAHQAGALDAAFLVLYGDSYLLVDVRDVWRFYNQQSEPALMTILRNEGRWDTSNAIFDGKHVTLYSKKPEQRRAEMRYIDYGLSVLTRSVIDSEIPAGVPYDLAELFYQLSLRGDLAGYEVKTRFYEIGSPAGLADFEQYIRSMQTV
jgi:NDP-sugar pyrophosphorylase family protein